LLMLCIVVLMLFLGVQDGVLGDYIVNLVNETAFHKGQGIFTTLKTATGCIR
jgi:hypothetical protein